MSEMPVSALKRSEAFCQPGLESAVRRWRLELRKALNEAEGQSCDKVVANFSASGLSNGLLNPPGLSSSALERAAGQRSCCCLWFGSK